MKVLVADDDRSSRLLVAGLVRRLGFQVCQASDGLEALAELRGPDPPQLAILDWIMPGIDGLRLCRLIRTESPEHYTYVILLTAKDSAAEAVEGLDSGADDFVAKPIEQNVLGARLRSGQRVIELQEQLIAASKRLREQATHDSLTGLWNRGTIMEILHRELARCNREQQPFGVIMCDIDHFKHINDTYGHLVGDVVLQQAAQRLSTAIRSYDYVGRYGGEEFLIILPNCPPTQAAEIAERVRAAIAAQAIVHQGESIPLTISVGVMAQTAPATGMEMLRQADTCLLTAKRTGRNRVVYLQDESATAI